MATIAILFHERTPDPAEYKVHYLAEFWRAAGHRVVYLFGTRRFIPADIVLIHVDLSVVPSDYLRFSDRYPKVINRTLTDIRKSNISKSLLAGGDAWEGPVIVKSNLNYGGKPEKDLARVQERFFRRAVRRARRLLRLSDPRPKMFPYSVFPSLSDVPITLKNRRDLVIEKYFPEIEAGLYRVRIHQVLGDRWTSTRLASREPIVKGSNSVFSEDIPPHPIVDQWRRDLEVDYGKLDYVVVDGRPILLDVNKTIGEPSRDEASETIRLRRRHIAEGIDSYLDR